MAKPLARYATLGDFVEVARGYGLDPGDLLRSSGLDPAGIGVPDRWVPAERIVDLLDRSAQLSGRDDFGLALAERRRFSGLGPLSMVIREEPDVRSALRVLIRYQDMYNEALRSGIVESGGVSAVQLTLDAGPPDRRRQSTELAARRRDGLAPTSDSCDAACPCYARAAPVSIGLTRSTKRESGESPELPRSGDGNDSGRITGSSDDPGRDRR